LIDPGAWLAARGTARRRERTSRLVLDRTQSEPFNHAALPVIAVKSRADRNLHALCAPGTQVGKSQILGRARVVTRFCDKTASMLSGRKEKFGQGRRQPPQEQTGRQNRSTVEA
jgi:hypothetical protein